MSDYLIYEKNLQVLKVEHAHTKPNENGEVKDYAKLSLFDRDNSVLISVNCYDFDRYALFEENHFYDFKMKVSINNNKFNFWLL